MKTFWRKFVKWQPFSKLSRLQEILLIAFIVVVIKIFFSLV
jgi:hypothetical protein